MTFYNYTHMKYFILIIFLLPLSGLSQVGIGTASPQATLDVRISDPAAPTAAAGIAIPQVNVLPPAGNRAGQVVILTTDNKIYFFNGTNWVTGASNPITGGAATGTSTSWQTAGNVIITALTATRAAGTDPIIDANAIMNLREWKTAGDGSIEETIVITSDGTGGAAGSGYYIINTQFPIDTNKHTIYTGNLNATLTNTPATYATNIGVGLVAQNNAYAKVYAIPISATQIAIATLPGNFGNAFIGRFHFSPSVANWQLKLDLKYTKAP